MTRKSSILWGGLSLLSLGYTANRFLERDEISTIGTLGVFVGIAGILYNLYGRNREQSKKTEDKPEKKKVKPGRPAEESVVPGTGSEVVIEPRRRAEEPEVTPEEVIWNRKYWDRRMEVDQRSFYKNIMELTGWRGEEPELGLLEKLVGPIHRGSDGTNTPRDKFSDYTGKYEQLKDSLTWDNVDQLWPEDLIQLLSRLKENMSFYRDSVIPEVERNEWSFKPGRKEFLSDVYERVEKVEDAYRTLSPSVSELIEKRKSQQGNQRPDDLDELGEYLNTSNLGLILALRGTKIHLSSDGRSKWPETQYRGAHAQRIFDNYDTTLERLTGEDNSLKVYLDRELEAT